MLHTIVRLTVQDFETFKSVFEGAAELRRQYGSKGVHVLRNIDKPNEVALFAEYENLERARQLFQSPEFRDAVKSAGVMGPPDISFYDEIAELPV